jgi:hypothetical protein
MQEPTLLTWLTFVVSVSIDFPPVCSDPRLSSFPTARLCSVFAAPFAASHVPAFASSVCIWKHAVSSQSALRRPFAASTQQQGCAELFLAAFFTLSSARGHVWMGCWLDRRLREFHVHGADLSWILGQAHKSSKQSYGSRIWMLARRHSAVL